MPNVCCIETYKKLTRSRELVDHWEGRINLLEEDDELLEKEYWELKIWREKYYESLYKFVVGEVYQSDESAPKKLARYELLRAHKEGKINLLADKVKALHDEANALTEWIKDFPEE